MTHIDTLRYTQTNTNNGYRQPKPHFVLTITPGLPLHEEGDQEDFGCLPFFSVISIALCFGAGHIVPTAGLLTVGPAQLPPQC